MTKRKQNYHKNNYNIFYFILFFPFSKKQKCSWKGSMTKRKQNIPYSPKNRKPNKTKMFLEMFLERFYDKIT